MARIPAQDRKKAGSYHHGDLRRVLIESALALITEIGPRGVTLREVARLAGVSVAAPYRHFADKDALLAAVAEEGFLLLADAMRARVEKHPRDAERRYLECGVAYVLFAIERPAHFRVMFSATPDLWASNPTLIAAGDKSFQVLLDVVEGCLAAELFRAGPALSVALGAWAMVHGLAMLFIDRLVSRHGLDASHAEAVTRAAAKTHIDGLRRRSDDKPVKKIKR